VGQDRRNVAGHEILAVPQANHGRRACACCNDLVGVLGGQNGEGIDAGELSHCFPHGVLQRAAVLHVFFHQVGDNFSICFGDELVAFFFKLALQLDVIFHNAVMDDDDLAGAIPVGMRVLFGWTSMRGPARVADAVRAVDGGLPDYFLKIVKFSRCTPDFHFAVLSDNGDARGIVAAIFQPPQTIQDERNDFLGADISDDSTHCFLSERGS